MSANTDPGLDDGEHQALRGVAGLMIPACAAQGMPGADDDAVFADIVRSLGRDTAAVRRALRRLDTLAGGRFGELPGAAREEAARRLREECPPLAAVLVAVVVRCYYRDDRVIRAIGMEPRPPYPQGFEVAGGDYSLLDPVRARGPIWRKVS